MNAENLGRFFTTPQQRVYLDQMRYRPPEPPPPKPLAQEPVEQSLIANKPKKKKKPKLVKKEVIPSVTVNGLVKRADGNNTVWVNGRSTQEGDVPPEKIQVDVKTASQDAIKVQLLQKDKTLQIRPGETFTPEYDRVLDRYQESIIKPSTGKN